MVKRLLIIFSVVSFAMILVSPAVANFGKDCSHGSNKVECRPDPSDNGKDCEEHGRGGINEDHCSTPIPSVTGTPSGSPTAEPSESPSASPSPSESPTVGETPSPTPSATVSSRPLPDSSPVASSSGTPIAPRVESKPPIGSLPATGIGLIFRLLALGIGFILLGVVLLSFAQPSLDDRSKRQ